MPKSVSYSLIRSDSPQSNQTQNPTFKNEIQIVAYKPQSKNAQIKNGGRNPVETFVESTPAQGFSFNFLLKAKKYLKNNSLVSDASVFMYENQESQRYEYVDRVVALYDFQSTTPETLGFQKDAVINILEKNGDWWLGELNGRCGILPYNYVQSVKKGKYRLEIL
jgi:hypothetical protein